MPAKTKHGHAQSKSSAASPTYRSWSHMMTRCYNRKFEGFQWYGGKGIKVCERWLIFENFLGDMGERPAGTTLDRWDSSKNYELGNCKWSTSKEQGRSSRRMALFDGRPMMRKEIAAHLGITHVTLNQRMRDGRLVLEEM
jgi:hypothetical protein